MKLTQIEVWSSPNGRQTFLKRYYTNPDIEHTVWLYPHKVTTYLYKGNMNQPYEPGIHHRVRPL